MKNLILAATMALSMLSVSTVASAQDTDNDAPKAPPVLIADETWLHHMKSGIKVVTYNSQISQKLIAKYTPCQCFRYYFTFKKQDGSDQKEPQWSIYFKSEKEAEIRNFLK